MECGCEAPYLGGTLGTTCSGGATLLFMTLLDSFIRNRCDISEICDRVKPKHLPDMEYDFVVIGGGSGGATAAGLLAKEKKWNVLLIEVGNDEPVGTQVPSMVLNYFDHHEIDWRYKTEPEPIGCQGYPEKRCDWIRGKVLGGCGVLNGMMYMRGVPRDFDNWAAAGNPGWSYNDVLPVFMRHEDNTEIGTFADAGYHGTGGPLTVARFPNHPEFAEDVLLAGKEIGHPVSNDLNGKQLTGFTIAQTNNRNGVRLSAAKAFLRPERNNPMLHVMLNSTATKIGIETVNGKKRANEVHFVYADKPYTVRVRKEVIVAGGAINTPQLLMLSGIGPKDELEKVGIPLVHELPGVGRNLQNHVSFYMGFTLNKINNTNDLDWAQVMNYILNRDGPMSGTGMSQVTARANSKYADPAGNYPDVQVFFSGYLAKCATTGEVKASADPEHPDMPRHVGMSPVYLHPKSRGHLSLRSAKPFDYPLLYANYLTEPEDVKTLVEGVRLALAVGKSKLLIEKYGIELVKDDYGDCAKQNVYDSDDFWACAVKYYTGPENHQIGTCKMGPDNDPKAVVNQKLQVKGIDNMRIVDASVIPNLVSGNTAATIMMIADRGVEFIKETYAVPNLSSNSNFPGSGKPYAPPNQGPPSRPHNHGPHHGHNKGYLPPFNHNYDFHQRNPNLPNPYEQN